MMFYKKTSRLSKTEYANLKIIQCLNCLAALDALSTESVSQQTV